MPWKNDPDGWQKILDGAKVQADLAVVAEQLNEVAKGVFLSQSEGDSEAPVYYVQSFNVRRVRHTPTPNPLYQEGKRGVAASNNDRTAEWVEFGAHAGGKTPVLKYRVFGKAMDILHSRFRA